MIQAPYGAFFIGCICMNILTKRRKRHRNNAQIKNPKAVRPHKHLAGRTGQIQHKKTFGKATHYSSHFPNPPVTIDSLGGPLF